MSEKKIGRYHGKKGQVNDLQKSHFVCQQTAQIGKAGPQPEKNGQRCGSLPFRGPQYVNPEERDEGIA